MKTEWNGIYKAFLMMAALVTCFAADASAQRCESIFAQTLQVETLSVENAMAIARSRATENALELIDNPNAWPPNARVLIDLVQDQSHAAKPPIPNFVLTLFARKMFAKKIVPLILDEGNESPKLKKMWFETSSMEFQGHVSTLQAHTLIEMNARDVSTVLTSFVRSMYHPVLGNKVFKIDVVE